MTTPSPLRFGLAGTGHWARVTYGPALAAADSIELAAVWGRNGAAAAALAQAHGAVAATDFDDLLHRVDAVAFSVPPDVQAGLAVRAAQAGKALLLEKPLALSEADAGAVAGAVTETGVASVTFFTHRFVPRVRDWLAQAAERGPWSGGDVTWLGRSLDPASPFNTPWRQARGGLWDLGPHAVSLLWACLGPVTSVTADAGGADRTHLILRHAGGASSTVTVTLSAPPAAEFAAASIWGTAGRLVAPLQPVDAVAALRTAAGELAANARAGRARHPCDAAFGQAVVAVLAAAETQIVARTAPGRDH